VSNWYDFVLVDFDLGLKFPYLIFSICFDREVISTEVKLPLSIFGVGFKLMASSVFCFLAFLFGQECVMVSNLDFVFSLCIDRVLQRKLSIIDRVSNQRYLKF